MHSQENMNRVFEKLRQLPPGRVGEVEDFIDFINHRSRERGLTRDAQAATDPILKNIWNNNEDAAYDDL